MIISLDEFKELSGITDGELDDFLTYQLEVVSEAVEAYCRRKFYSATYIQTFYKEDKSSSYGLTQLFCYPLTSISSVKLDGVMFSLAGTSIRVDKDTATLVDPKNELLYCDSMEVTYVAGPTVVPFIVKNVIVSIVKEYYTKKKSGISMSFGSDVQRVSIPGTLSIDFDYSLSSNERSSPFGSILGVHLNALDYYRSERSIIGRGKLVYVS